MSWPIAIVVIVVLIILSGVVSSSEAAFFASSPAKIDELAEKGKKRAKAVQALLAKPNLFLSTIQVINTLIAFINGAIASSAFNEPILKNIFNIAPGSQNYLLYSTLVTIFITVFLLYWQIIFGELVPKRIGMKWPEKVSMIFVRFIQIIYYVMFPFVWLLTISTSFFARFFGVKPGDEVKNVTEEEIRLLVAAGTEKGGIDEEEGEMIDNIFEFDDTLVSEIMTHRTEITGISIDSNKDDVLSLIVNDKFTRYPVYEGTIDSIVGIIHVKDILKNIIEKKPFDLRVLLRTPYFVPESKKINDMFKEMQQDKVHIAVVIDEYGGTAGIVTIEDVIEEIVGDIDDEYDDFEKEIQELSSDQYEIDGLSDIADVEDVLEADLPVDDYDTLSGFMIGLLERLPSDDEKVSIIWHNYKFESLEIHDMVITKVLVTKIDLPEEDEDE